MFDVRARVATCSFIATWQTNINPKFFIDGLKEILALPMVGRLWRCFVLFEVTSMRYVLLSLSIYTLAIAQILTSRIYDCIE